MMNELSPRQRLLAFDTSTANLSVAVMEDNQLLAERSIKVERNHSSYLVKAVDEALTEARISKRELDGIIVGVGPGSYTGVRIAVTTAKTLAWALRIPVCSVSSLEAIALGGFAKAAGLDAGWFQSQTSGSGITKHWLVPMIEARRGQAYTALFSAEQGSLPKRLVPDEIRLMDGYVQELAEMLGELSTERQPAGVWFVGDYLLHEQTIEQLRPLLGDRLQVHSYDLEGLPLGLVGVDVYTQKQFSSLHDLVPNYTQLAEAEAKRLR